MKNDDFEASFHAPGIKNLPPTTWQFIKKKNSNIALFFLVFSFFCKFFKNFFYLNNIISYIKVYDPAEHPKLNDPFQ